MVENEWIYITKQFFLKELPKFHLKSSNSYGPYWNIEFVDCNIAVEIGGDIGFHIQIYIYMIQNMISGNMIEVSMTK
jgi:hypothetical protein